ncbi:MAG: hypothetical protein ACRCYX_15590 [Dermatophilaceae bacterium]
MPPHRRHVWIVTTPHAPDGHPGLLLWWDSLGSGRWRELVTYVVELDTEERLVQEWIASDLVQPASDPAREQITPNPRQDLTNPSWRHGVTTGWCPLGVRSEGAACWRPP